VLLVTAGLFLRTLANLGQLDGGFRPERVLTLSVQPLGPAYQGPTLDALWADLLARVRNLRGVRSAAFSFMNPLDGRDSQTAVTAHGFHLQSSQDQIVHVNTVSDDYFETLGIPVLLGRDFAPGDIPSSPHVAILNETAAKSYFRDRNPLGETVDFGNGPYQLVGVLGDTKRGSLRENNQRFAYE
jgi:macrolide transport system ATP-binding/permease protein